MTESEFVQPIRVLVVDDEPSICRAVSLALSRAGLEAHTALSGDAALDVLRAMPVDVLLLDLRMPGMRGDVLFELAAAIQPALRHHTLFMTGDITERAQQLVAECNAPFLRKPFDLKDLVGAVRALVPRSRLDGTLDATA